MTPLDLNASPHIHAPTPATPRALERICVANLDIYVPVILPDSLNASPQNRVLTLLMFSAPDRTFVARLGANASMTPPDLNVSRRIALTPAMFHAMEIITFVAHPDSRALMTLPDNLNAR